MTSLNRHPAREVIERYVDADPTLDEVSVWALESHLESCPVCRAALAERVYADVPAVRRAGASDLALLDQVARTLSSPIRTGPPPVPVARRWTRMLRRWAVWSFVPWMLMTGLILLTALLLDATAVKHSSLVLVVAPVAPLLGVTAAWNRRTDPAWELVAGSPRSGLWLLLRRTFLILSLVVPLAVLVSLLGGHSPAVWLTPCLALTATTLALGGRFGVLRVAVVVAAGWALAVLSPSLQRGSGPVVLETVGIPAWLLLATAAAVMLLLRRDEFQHIASRQ
jgi:hypothetical protein